MKTTILIYCLAWGAGICTGAGCFIMCWLDSRKPKPPKRWTVDCRGMVRGMK